MRQYLSSTRGVLTASLAGTVLLFWSAISFAGTPTLGPDCGTGAAVVGSDSAGKVTIGAGMAGTCTLTFSVPYTNAPACSATNETNGGGSAVFVGARTTPATMEMDQISPWNSGDVISYSCQEY